MSIFEYLKNLKSFSVIIIPDVTTQEAKSRKFTLSKVLTFVLIYSIFIAISGYYFFNFTGIGYKLLPGKFVMSSDYVEKMEELNDKIIFLAKELQMFKSANQRLKYALILGDSVLADSFKIAPDTIEQYYKKPSEGNLFGALLNFAGKFFNREKKSIFFIFPANGYISRGFDPEKGHYGIDIVVKVGTPVYASAGGFVVFSGYTNNYGHLIILSHSDGYISIYKHCSLLLKKEREIVKQGELIAQSGNSGLATTGPHLHFEIWHNGEPVDPEILLINNK
jgi:murein DD-endopeptidase MepM/ murein hydrolase activator NlpD